MFLITPSHLTLLLWLLDLHVLRFFSLPFPPSEWKILRSETCIHFDLIRWCSTDSATTQRDSRPSKGLTSVSLCPVLQSETPVFRLWILLIRDTLSTSTRLSTYVHVSPSSLSLFENFRRSGSLEDWEVVVTYVSRFTPSSSVPFGPSSFNLYSSTFPFENDEWSVSFENRSLYSSFPSFRPRTRPWLCHLLIRYWGGLGRL